MPYSFLTSRPSSHIPPLNFVPGSIAHSDSLQNRHSPNERQQPPIGKLKRSFTNAAPLIHKPNKFLMHGCAIIKVTKRWSSDSLDFDKSGNAQSLLFSKSANPQLPSFTMPLLSNNTQARRIR